MLGCRIGRIVLRAPVAAMLRRMVAGMLAVVMPRRTVAAILAVAMLRGMVASIVAVALRWHTTMSGPVGRAVDSARIRARAAGVLPRTPMVAAIPGPTLEVARVRTSAVGTPTATSAVAVTQLQTLAAVIRPRMLVAVGLGRRREAVGIPRVVVHVSPRAIMVGTGLRGIANRLSLGRVASG
jgi:hypothetical protein